MWGCGVLRVSACVLVAALVFARMSVEELCIEISLDWCVGVRVVVGMRWVRRGLVW